MSERTETEIKAMTKEQNYFAGYSDAKSDVLNEIRDEIMKLDDINPDYPMDRTIHISRNEVLQIIDKYRPESEDKVNCDKKDCYNCLNHNYCDYEEESEE